MSAKCTAPPTLGIRGYQRRMLPSRGCLQNAAVANGATCSGGIIKISGDSVARTTSWPHIRHTTKLQFQSISGGSANNAIYRHIAVPRCLGDQVPNVLLGECGAVINSPSADCEQQYYRQSKCCLMAKRNITPKRIEVDCKVTLDAQNTPTLTTTTAGCNNGFTPLMRRGCACIHAIYFDFTPQACILFHFHFLA